MTGAGERVKSPPGNGLKGIRFTLAGKPFSNAAKALASPAESFTWFNMTYSKVTGWPLASL